MPSPIAHAVAAFAISAGFGSAEESATQPVARHRIPRLFPLAVVLCLLPDFPSAIGLVTGDFARFHNSWEHSLFVGVGVAALLAAILSAAGDRPYWRWFAIVLLCYESHVLMDYFTIGRGVKVLWPFSWERFQPPFMLFYGFHWSDGWFTVRHLWTAATELAFGVLVLLGVSTLTRSSGRR